MRKGLIVSIAGALIVGTVMICNIGKVEVYEKKSNFKDTNEVIEVINSAPIGIYDETIGDTIYSDDFLETLSYRKRATDPRVPFSSLKLEIDEDNNSEEKKKGILDDYIAKCKKLKNYKVQDNAQAIVLKAKASNIYPSYDEKDNKYYVELNYTINIVLIDEGEGYVIDYLTFESIEEGEKNDTSLTQ